MKNAEKIALAYTVSVAGAAAISYWRGRQTSEILVDALMHGAVAGTALTVVGWLLTESGDEIPVLASANHAIGEVEALFNGSEAHDNGTDDPHRVGLGKLGKQGVALLSRLNGSEILRDLKENGVKFGEVPPNPSIINQDAD